ncbi:ogr/Delta-like zinc finger family protein [Buttiauxella agrestis]|uniref:ogr/Delta-like zinc finger family protein n=1 Tax=Buttiauxella agrestis TaxID=82977 RepID=UPI0039752E76
MMRCPLCCAAGHTREAAYLEDGSKETIVQCQNVYCSATFMTHECFYMALENSPLKADYKSRLVQADAGAEQGSNNG